MIPIIFGEVLFDFFPDGKKILGGAPFNVAWHLRGLGLDPLFISRVGNDKEGEEILHAMKKWQMDTRGIQKDSKHLTGKVNVSFSKEGNPHFETLHPRAYDFIQKKEIQDFLSNLPSEDWKREKISILYHGSLILRSPDSLKAWEYLAEELQKPIFLDINLRPPNWSPETVELCLRKASYCKLNDNELLQISPQKNQEETLKNLESNLIQKYHLQLLLLTMAEKGAILTNRNQSIDSKDLSKNLEASQKKNDPIVDTVGAGDAFSAVSILGILRNWNLETILSRSIEFAQAICSIQGAIPENPEFYSPFLENWDRSDQKDTEQKNVQ